MLTNLWRFLFVPKQWTVIGNTEIKNKDKLVKGYVFILQDQYGNIKEKRIMA